MTSEEKREAKKLAKLIKQFKKDTKVKMKLKSVREI